MKQITIDEISQAVSTILGTSKAEAKERLKECYKRIVDTESGLNELYKENCYENCKHWTQDEYDEPNEGMCRSFHCLRDENHDQYSITKRDDICSFFKKEETK